MPLPTHCPKCQAPFPESLERFGTNAACKRCGQVLRLPDLPPLEEPPLVAPLEKQENVVEIAGPRQLAPIDQIMVKAWKLFLGRFGLCVVLFLISLIVRLALIAPEYFGNEILKGQELELATQIEIAAVIGMTVLVRLVVFVWLDIGIHQILLNIVRGKPTSLKDLLRGGPYFWRAFMGGVIFEFAIAVGVVLGILPGVLFALVFWPYLYVLIDTNAPGLSCFPIAAAFTHGNKIAVLGLSAISLLVCVFGFLALVVGVLIALPYVHLMFALAYESMAHGLPDEEDEE